MVADAITKALTRDGHRELIAKMGVGSVQQRITVSPIEDDQSRAHQGVTLSGRGSAKTTSDERGIRGIQGIGECWKMPAKMIINAVDWYIYSCRSFVGSCGVGLIVSALSIIFIIH
jgi:hypothetical protein